MPLPATLSDTELSAVNQILGAVGQAPISTLDQTNPDVDIVYTTLTDVSRETQAEGWAFNTEYEYKFLPDTNSEILIPQNILQMTLSDLPENKSIDVVQRDSKLYNKTDHTFTWLKAVYMDVIWLFNYTDLPQVFKDYITARSAVVCATKMLGDSTQFQLLRDREGYLKSMILTHECDTGNYSMFGFPNGNKFYSPYQPFQTIAR